MFDLLCLSLTSDTWLDHWWLPFEKFSLDRSMRGGNLNELSISLVEILEISILIFLALNHLDTYVYCKDALNCIRCLYWPFVPPFPSPSLPIQHVMCLIEQCSDLAIPLCNPLNLGEVVWPKLDPSIKVSESVGNVIVNKNAHLILVWISLLIRFSNISHSQPWKEISGF